MIGESLRLVSFLGIMLLLFLRGSYLLSNTHNLHKPHSKHSTWRQGWRKIKHHSNLVIYTLLTLLLLLLRKRLLEK